MRATLVGADSLSAMGALLPGLSFNRKRMEQAMAPDITATHVALRKVTEGAAFRNAYRAAASNGNDTLSVAEALKAYASEGASCGIAWRLSKGRNKTFQVLCFLFFVLCSSCMVQRAAFLVLGGFLHNESDG